ncbi:MAG: pyridoxine 5'-phosphate synthase [Candidatus Margulisiibacteriota bacterium]
MTKLGVNIDHIATLRQARKEGFPLPVEAAKICMKAGADGIVAHLREDRRHIQDKDIFLIRKAVKRFDMEMAATKEMLKIALKVKPDMVTLVPEKRQEVTTEGGLDVKKQIKYLTGYCDKLQSKGILASLFIDPDPIQIAAAARTGASFIEIHTGDYANSKSQIPLDFARGRPNPKQVLNSKFKTVVNAVRYAKVLGLRVNAGHGLTLENACPIAKIPGIEELNIGYSIIVDAVFNGLENAVKRMKRAIK